MRTRSTLMVLTLAGSLLGACHKQDEQPADNQSPKAPAPVQQTPVAAPKPTTKSAPKPGATKPKALPKPTADEQMIDDADATGMTSHASRDPDTSDAASNSQP